MIPKNINKNNAKCFLNKAILFSPVFSIILIEMLHFNPVGFFYFMYSALTGALVYFLVLVMNIEINTFIQNQKQENKPLKDVAMFALSSYLVVFIYTVGSSNISKEILVLGHILCFVIIFFYVLTISFFEMHRRKHITNQIKIKKTLSQKRVLHHAHRAKARKYY